MTHLTILPALAVCVLFLAACADGPGRQMTPAEQAQFADEMTQPDQMTTGQIPSANPFP